MEIKKTKERRGCWVDEGLKGDGRQEIWDRVSLFFFWGAKKTLEDASARWQHTANNNAGTGCVGRDFAATVRSRARRFCFCRYLFVTDSLLAGPCWLKRALYGRLISIRVTQNSLYSGSALRWLFCGLP